MMKTTRNKQLMCGDECATKRRPRERKDMTLDIIFDDSKEEPWLVKN